MSNLFKKLTSGIEKAAKVLHLTRMKVLYQIIIIILVMGIFMVIQGYMGITVMGNLQNTTQIVYNDTANKLKDLAQLKIDADQIALTYIQVTASGQKNTDNVDESASITYANVQDLINRAKAKTSYLEGLDASTKKRITGQLEAISQTIQNNPGIQGYDSINRSMVSIKTDIDTAYSICFNAALEVISKNQNYAAVSQKISITIVVLSLVLSLFIGLIVATAISKPLRTMETATKTLAMGDLSLDIGAEGSPEVMKTIAEFNKATAGLRELVIGINQQSDVLFTASNELTGATNETRQSAMQVATTMEELAKASSEQASQVTHAVDTMQLLSKLVTKVSSDTENIASTSEQVAQSAKTGQKATIDVSNEINELYSSTQKVAKVIDGLNETSGEIDEITAVIHGIAEQTTLLALNASIEAARAGEHGKGFAVVANETGKLAEQSKQAASHIADLVMQMRLRTEQSVQEITESTQRAELCKKLASEANITFGKIFDSLEATLGEIDAVAKTAKQMADSNNDATSAITTIAAISEESMASTQEVSATAEEQSASVQQLSALAEGLTQIAGSLKQSVAIFNLGNGI